MMKKLAIIIIIVGTLLLFFNTCRYNAEYPVREDRNVIVNREEQQRITWPWYTGLIILVGGLILLYSERSRPKY